MELDSCNSSDALLMNCFCYPGAAERVLRGCLGNAPNGSVEFGVGGNVPLSDGKPDATELDMRVGNVIFEAKLTESSFTCKRAAVVEAYRDFDDVFDASLLPRIKGEYQGYQLIRNLLAAAAHGYHFVALCDGRRPDLLHEWWTVQPPSGIPTSGCAPTSCSGRRWRRPARPRSRRTCARSTAIRQVPWIRIRANRATSRREGCLCHARSDRP